jgi:hypothetical protein
LLESSIEFSSPLLEAVIVYVYGGFFARCKISTLHKLSANPNQYPFQFEMLTYSAEAVWNFLRHAIELHASLHASVLRFKAYVEWFARQEITEILEVIAEKYLADYLTWKADPSRPHPKYAVEKPLHGYLNLFFFGEGFFPLVNFPLMGDEPDTLALPSALGPSLAGVPVLIEVKQLVNPKLNAEAGGDKRPSRRYVEKGLSQLFTYMDKLRTAGPIAPVEGVLLIFYNSPRPLAGIYPTFRTEAVMLVNFYR